MNVRRAFWTLFLVTALIASAAAASVAAQGQGNRSRDDDSKDRGKGSQGGSDRPREPGRIVQSNLSNYEGRYIGFSFDASTCEIRDYQVHNVTLLPRIQLQQPCDAKDKDGRRSEHGAFLQIGSGASHVRIHDAPNGLLHLRVQQGSIQIYPSHEAEIDEDDEQASLTLDNLTALLRFENASKGADSWNLTGGARFWVHASAADSPQREEIHEAIRERKVAGEVDVLLTNGTISSEVLTYEDVIVRAQSTQWGSFRFLVDGNLTTGRTFVVNLGPGLFEQEKVGLRYWDVDQTSHATEVPIGEADSLQDVLEILPGEGPEYWITQDADGKHVLVGVPRFSVHVFEIMGASAQIVPNILWGALGGVVFVALGAAGLRRRQSS